MVVIYIVIGLVGGLAIGFAAAAVVQGRRRAEEVRRAEDRAGQIVHEAELKAESLIRESQIAAKELELKGREKEESVKGREVALRERDSQLDRREDALQRREKEVERHGGEVERREVAVKTAEDRAAAREAEADKVLEESRRMLEERAGLTRDDARNEIISTVTDAAKLEAAKHVKRIEDEARDTADRKAKRIISTAIMRYAGEYVSERTVSVVTLPNDDMKGRIIGREGRNIRAFEAATGVDLVIDDTPEAISLSAFDPVRREVARIALERLIADGRIHPTRIEEIVEKTTQEIDQVIKEAGEFAVMELDVGGMHADLVRTLGRLKYRRSYAQNVLHHAIEVGFLAGMMMAELGLDPKLGRRAGLLHDIGKAIDHEEEGPHAVIGARLAKKYGEKPPVVHAIAAHHEDEKPNSVLACIVTAADAMSGARPGARREMLESYIKRLEDLEAISMSFKGVEKSYAIQAGRELRIMVESEKVGDEAAFMLARDIATKIEEKLTYPGQIKVTVIRETRAIEYAR